jgi:DNA-binding response OmpR family regulator
LQDGSAAKLVGQKMAERLARILIVDHSGGEAATLQSCVNGEDRIVAVAEEFRELMATAAEYRPDLVVLVARPQIEGVCTECQTLKRGLPKALVLIIGTVDELWDIELVVDAGADDFLTSPIDEAELTKRVDNLLRLSRVI